MGLLSDPHKEEILPVLLSGVSWFSMKVHSDADDLKCIKHIK